MNAYEEVIDYMNEGETPEHIVFGAWGGGSDDFSTPGYEEPEPPPVPFEKRGIVMRFVDAHKFMQGWRFSGGYGSPECYAVYIWTNQRVIWVTQYDGATGLDSAPRCPLNIIPDMPGG